MFLVSLSTHLLFLFIFLFSVAPFILICVISRVVSIMTSSIDIFCFQVNLDINLINSGVSW